MTIYRFNRRRMIQLYMHNRFLAVQMVHTGDDWEFFQFLGRWFCEE